MKVRRKRLLEPRALARVSFSMSADSPRTGAATFSVLRESASVPGRRFAWGKVLRSKDPLISWSLYWALCMVGFDQPLWPHSSAELLLLTPKEFELLNYLMKYLDKPMAHTPLLRAVWGEESALQMKYLRTFVHQLRKKLEDDPLEPKYLLMELDFGYRFQHDL